MTAVFISYARETEVQARRVAETLRALGHGVWLDDQLPAHRGYAEVIEERLRAAKAVVVIWSAEAVKSEWVQSEADRAREDRKLVQLSLDGSKLPMPFDRIQCADLAGWNGEADHAGWRKVLASVAELVGAPAPPPSSEPTPPLPTKPSIVVLPFTRLSADADQDYFADGMVEEIVAALSRMPSIFVIGSGSGLSFKGTNVSPEEAARRLGVRFVLEGSVRKAGGRVRIAVKLTDAVTGAHVWADRFEDTLEDVFALQDKVALSVASILEPTIMWAEVRRAAARPTQNMSSYDLFLRTIPLLSSFGEAGVAESIDLLEKAIVLDPRYAMAQAAAAMAYSQSLVQGWSTDPRAHRDRGLELAKRALREAPDDPGVLNFVATAQWQLGENLDDAMALVDRSLALNPGSAIAWQTSGWIRIVAGKTDIGIEHLSTALRLDPLSNLRSLRLTGIGVGRIGQGRYEEAIALLKESAQLMADYPTNQALLAYCHGKLGQNVLAMEAIGHLETLTHHTIEEWAVSPAFRADFLKTIAAVRAAQTIVPSALPQ